MTQKTKWQLSLALAISLAIAGVVASYTPSDAPAHRVADTVEKVGGAIKDVVDALPTVDAPDAGAGHDTPGQAAPLASPRRRGAELREDARAHRL